MTSQQCFINKYIIHCTCHHTHLTRTAHRVERIFPRLTGVPVWTSHFPRSFAVRGVTVLRVRVTVSAVAFHYIYKRHKLQNIQARRGGAEVAGWTLDRKIRVRFPACPHRVWALWWQGGKRRLRTSRCPCRGRLGTIKTPSCPWRGCPAAGQNLETGHMSRHYIAEILLNVTLNHKQQKQQQQQQKIQVNVGNKNIEIVILCP